MDLVARHRFSARPDEVTAAMMDPAFAPELVAITDVGAVEVVDHGDDGTSRWLSARLTYNGSLDPIAARVLGSSRPSWVQTYRVDSTSTSGRLDIRPDDHGSLLECTARLDFRPVDGGTERSLNGTLNVKVPLIGGRAERALGPAILARIDAEAALLESWLNRA